MKYITLKTSATGKKIAAVVEKIEAAKKAQTALSKEFGFIQWRQGFFAAAGGISAVMFPRETVVDKKVWKNVNSSRNEWMPKHSSKEGKEIAKKFAAVPRVEMQDVNKCVNYNNSLSGSIGLTWSNDKYFGIKVDEAWDVKMPADCKEVTTTEYHSLFPEEKPSKKMQHG